MSNLAKDIQSHLLESCRSLEELEIQMTALFSHLKLRERDGYLSRLNTHVPTATRKDLRGSPLVGEYIFDEELVSQAGNRLQGDVSLKSNTIMLDTLAKGQGQKARPLLSLSDPLQPYHLRSLIRDPNKILIPRAKVGVNPSAKANSQGIPPKREKAVEQKRVGTFLTSRHRHA